MSEILATSESTQKMKMGKKTRQKVKQEYIVKDSSRRITFRKRKNSLLKKVNELSILCGVSACLIIFWAEQAEPILWPCHEVVKELLQRFIDLPQAHKYSKTVDQETYLRDKLRKMEIKLRRQQRKNKEALAFYLMHQIYNEGRELSDLDMNEMDALFSLVSEKVKFNLTRNPLIRRHPVVSCAGPAGTSTVAAGDQPQAASFADGTNQSQSITWMDWSMPSFAQSVGDESGDGGPHDYSSSSLVIGEKESSGSYMALLLGDNDEDVDDNEEDGDTSGKAIEGSHVKEVACGNLETGGIGGADHEKVLADKISGGEIHGADGSSVVKRYDIVIGDRDVSIWDMSDENFLKLVGFGENGVDEGSSNDGGKIGINPSESHGHGGAGGSMPSGNLAAGSSKGNEEDDDTAAGLSKEEDSDYINMSWPLID